MKLRVMMSLLVVGSVIASLNSRISIFTGPEGGHPAVTYSLMQGLKKLQVPFDHNNYAHPAPIVVVLADTADLQRAIHLKQRGKIKFILAGPNLVIRASELHGLLGVPAVDTCIVPSDWVRVAYEQDVPALKGRIATWFAGVDVDFWQPLSAVKKNRVLIYWKTETADFYNRVEQHVKAKGFEPVCIRYNAYTKEQFKNALAQSLFAIFISKSESQGIALAEAWSMDVPTLVWNPKFLAAHGRTYDYVSAAPYLTSATGWEWQTFEDLEKKLESIQHLLLEVAPRAWVLEHMTFTHSAQRLLDIITATVA